MIIENEEKIIKHLDYAKTIAVGLREAGIFTGAFKKPVKDKIRDGYKLTYSLDVPSWIFLDFLKNKPELYEQNKALADEAKKIASDKLQQVEKWLKENDHDEVRATVAMADAGSFNNVTLVIRLFVPFYKSIALGEF